MSYYGGGGGGGYYKGWWFSMLPVTLMYYFFTAMYVFILYCWPDWAPGIYIWMTEWGFVDYIVYIYNLWYNISQVIG